MQRLWWCLGMVLLLAGPSLDAGAAPRKPRPDKNAPDPKPDPKADPKPDATPDKGTDAKATTGGGNVYLQQAREKYRELDYEALPALLAEALLQTDIKREEYVEIYKLQGFTYTARGDPAKARECYLKLLAIDPNYEMDASVSPRFRTGFGDIKKEFATRGAVSLTHQAVIKAAPGEGIPVELTVKDAFGRVSNAGAKVRAVMCGQEGAYVDVPLQSAGGREGERSFKGKLPDPASGIPGDKPAGYFVDYQLVFTNQVGDALDVSGGQPNYRVTVGDAAAAADACKASPASGGGAAAGEEGGGSVLPVLLGGLAAGGGVLVLVGLLAVGGAVTGGVVAGVFCNLNRATCNLPRPSPNGRVEVTVNRGSTQ